MPPRVDQTPGLARRKEEETDKVPPALLSYGVMHLQVLAALF